MKLYSKGAETNVSNLSSQYIIFLKFPFPYTATYVITLIRMWISIIQRLMLIDFTTKGG